MHTSAIAVAASLLLAFIYFLPIVRQAFFSPLSKVPGPWYASLTNLCLKLAVMTGRRSQYIHTLHMRYGSMVRISPDEVSCSSLEAFKQIHRIGTPFMKSSFYEAMSTGPDEGQHLGIFSFTNPRAHAARRRLLSRGFSQNYLRDRWEDVVRAKVKLAVSNMKAEGVSAGKSDMLKWWMFMASDVTSHLMFGQSFGMLESGLKAAYIEAIEMTMVGSAIRYEMPLMWKIMSRIPLASIQTFVQANDTLFVQGGLALANSRSLSASSTESVNIFSTIINEAEKGDEKLQDIDVQIEAGNLIIAGSDTTANTLCYLIWAVMSQPSAKKALEDELQSVDVETVDAELEKLPVLNAIIDEALRLYGAAPGSLPRVVPQGGATVDGYYLPQGSVVSTQAWTFHRDPKYFLDPDRFDYTRWLTPGQISNESKAAFSPFGAGSRICLGLHLARMELRLATVCFFKECNKARLAPSVTPESMEVENYFLITPKSHRCEVVL